MEHAADVSLRPSPGVVRVEDVPGEMLGLLPRWRLLPEAIRGPAGLDGGGATVSHHFPSTPTLSERNNCLNSLCCCGVEQLKVKSFRFLLFF